MKLLHFSIRGLLPGLYLLASAVLPAADLRISGPYTHDNLSIFLLHGDSNSQGSGLMTLQEAMEQKKVVVNETGRVNELSVENNSSLDVFIQSGDIVKGGRQDRVLVTDLILPAHSGKISIPAFCVEHGRWTKRGDEADAAFNSSRSALPSKSLKLAVREEQNQSKVWAEVSNTQDKLAHGAGSGRSTSRDMVRAMASPTSMQLSMESKPVVDQTGAYVQSLSRIVDGRNDVIGYAYSINGKLNSAEVYATNDLFRRMWPKMLQASATEALSERNATHSAGGKPVGVAQVKAALSDGDNAPQVSKDKAGQATVIKRVSGNMVVLESEDRKAWIHKSYVVK